MFIWVFSHVILYLFQVYGTFRGLLRSFSGGVGPWDLWAKRPLGLRGWFLGPPFPPPSPSLGAVVPFGRGFSLVAIV